jgi:hypothetical protein
MGDILPSSGPVPRSRILPTSGLSGPPGASVASRASPVMPDKTGIEALGKIAPETPGCRTFGSVPVNFRGDSLPVRPFSSPVIAPDETGVVAGHQYLPGILQVRHSVHPSWVLSGGCYSASPERQLLRQFLKACIRPESSRFPGIHDGRRKAGPVSLWAGFFEVQV